MKKYILSAFFLVVFASAAFGDIGLGGGSGNVALKDGPALDAFGRQRVSTPYTLFDSKQLFDNSPLFWDDAEMSGGGTSSSHSTFTAQTTLSVSNATAGLRVRQTFQRFQYQPGKSQLILMTGIIGSSTGTVRRIGYFDANNGLMFVSSSAVLGVGVRSNTSGSIVNSIVWNSAFNLDKLDGTGPSGISLDMTKANIFLIDFEWLGVGRVRFGVVVDGMVVYCHEILNANNTTGVYMSTPNLPLRYDIENLGSGPASSMGHICSSVISEGGQDKTGIVRSTTTGNTQCDANTAGKIYGVLGMRLKGGYIGTSIEQIGMSMFGSTANDNFLWMLIANPTIAGGLNYVDVANSAVQIATGATANVVTTGTVINSGYGRSQVSVQEILTNTLKLGVDLDGNRDAIWLCVMPVAAATNLDIYATMDWREMQ